MTFSDAADRCVHVACAKTTGAQTLMVEQANTDIIIEEKATGTHLMVGTLTTTAAKAIVAELQKQPAVPIIIHLAPSNSDGACHLDLKSEYELVACLSCCEVPLVTVCEDGVLVNAARCWLMAVADVVIVSESAKVSMSSLGQSTFDFRRKVWATHQQHRATQEDLDTHPVGAQAAFQAGLVDIIAPVHGLKQQLDLVLSRFKKVGNPLLRACKTQLPAVSLDVAALAMARLTVPTPMDTNGDLVRLTVSEDGLATVELNNPVHFNNQSPKLMADLALRLREVNRYAVVGKVNAMVLQGAGPHFCTGGWNPEGSEEKSTRAPSWSENMVTLSSTSETAAMIRRLPVPTFGAVHGKLIGGGVALALATDFIICSEGATFNFGNLPRGKNPLFMLSRSMSLAVGHGLANQSYLEDPVLTAEDVVAMGLAHGIAGSANEAKLVALQYGRTYVPRSTPFMHGPVSRLCADDPKHAAREVALFATLDDPLSTVKRSPQTKSRSAEQPLALSKIDPRWVGLSGEELSVQILEEVRAACESVLGDEANLDDDLPLMEAGVDSLGATELVNVLNSSVGLELPPTLLFNHPTISALAAHITAQIVERPTSLASNTSPPSAKTKHPQWAGLSGEELSARILPEVRIACESVLGDDLNLDDDLPLMEAGIDSLGATELVNVLNSSIGLELPSTLLFNHPTIRALTAHIVTQIQEPSRADEDTPPKNLQPGREQQPGLSLSSRRVKEPDVAIIGMSCRLPGGIEGSVMLWDVARAGSCTVTKVPFSRWDMDAEAASKPEFSIDMKNRMAWGGFVNNLDLFDAGFFRISTAEASAMDPQHRLLLEYSFLAFRDAGYDKKSLQGQNVGVFVGIAGSGSFGDGVYALSGALASGAVGRVSYVLGLQGPCAAYDTACSSSLTALHAAVRSLRADDCDLALVAGVNMLMPGAAVPFAVAGMTSPTGRCHTFDELADGYVRGEGSGAVVLQRMQDAVSDQNRLHAVVCGVGAAQDGTSASLTAPNGQAQEKLYNTALQDAELGHGGSTVDYLEAHGTGTALGDPIEMGSLAEVMGKGRGGDQPLVMGAVKANVGHTEMAAGVAGLLKAVLVLKHEQAPPNPELQTLNPKIAAVVKGFPVLFPRKVELLRLLSDNAESDRLVAGVSSFGAYGTIAHAVIAQAPTEEVRELTDHTVPGIEATPIVSSVLILFTGQGSQYEDMGRGLFKNEPVLHTALDRCEAAFSRITGESLLEVMHPEKRGERAADHDDGAQNTKTLLDQTQYTQPALFAFCLRTASAWSSSF